MKKVFFLLSFVCICSALSASNAPSSGGLFFNIGEIEIVKKEQVSTIVVPSQYANWSNASSQGSQRLVISAKEYAMPTIDLHENCTSTSTCANGNTVTATASSCAASDAAVIAALKGGFCRQR